MGLLKRMLGMEAVPTSNRGVALREDTDERDERWAEQAQRFGDIRVDVVGESHYQPAIRKACNYKRGTDTFFECMAELVPEPTNAFDRNAVRVHVDGQLVGHLSRADAVTLGPQIRETITRHGSAICNAVVAGHAHGETDNLGVFLHLNAHID